MLVDEKYDGIRAQVHKSAAGVRVFSRTLDEIVEFPELNVFFAKLPGELILDGKYSLGTVRGRCPSRNCKNAWAENNSIFGCNTKFPCALRPSICSIRTELYCWTKRWSSGAHAWKNFCHLATHRQSIPPRQFAVSLLLQFSKPSRIRWPPGTKACVVKRPESLYTPGRRGQIVVQAERALRNARCSRHRRRGWDMARGMGCFPTTPFQYVTVINF